MLIAITREIGPNINHCELTHFARAPIDLGRARTQHREYRNCLAELGCKIIALPAEPDLPDSVFVEDAALVLDELAVILRPGAASRRPETASIAAALKPFRPLTYLESPGTIDGGDILRLGKKIFVGLTSRSNPQGIEQLQNLTKSYGYEVQGVPVHGCLHLKSAVTQVAADALLLNPAWIDAEALPKLRQLEVDPAEPNAANGLLLGETVIYPAAFPATQCRLQSQGIPLRLIDVSELAKAEAAVTCCSLVFYNRSQGTVPIFAAQKMMVP
ncbi:MAG: dimethylargininase [Pirellulales bacterium]|nr:dimethylargininase [Pirellulales bacterium]